MKKKSLNAKRSIFARQTVSYILIIMVLSATFGFFFFATAKSHLEQEVGRKLQDIANIAAKNAPVERLKLIKVGDDETRMVLRLKEKFGDIREATGVDNIFIFYPDGTSLLDLRAEKPIGFQYSLRHFDKAFINALNKNESVSTGSYRSSSGTLFISAFAPIVDSENQLFAVVGVDAGTREVEVIEQMRSRLYLIAGLGVVLSIGLALILARTLAKPIQSMAKAAERIGHGDYEARVDLPSTTELQVLAESINIMAEQVQSRDAKLKEMTASVAHEIRNPLNSIKLLLSLHGENLQEQYGTPPPKELETLHYEIRKLNRFLTEFLTYSRPISLIQDEVSPFELAQNALDMAKAEAETKGIEVTLTAEPDLPRITVDRQRLEQSILNILLNAIVASENEGTAALHVRRSEGNSWIDFIIEDSGPGIPEEIMSKLFEPFFTTRDSGTGLGLSNAQKIVESHGGLILAQNKEEGGARFVIRLPITGLNSKER